MTKTRLNPTLIGILSNVAVGFKCEKVNETMNRGWRYRFYFENGYGVSVVKHDFSYGGDSDKWELAVLKDDKPFSYTPITHDVIGWLNDEEVFDTAMRVFALKADGSDETLPDELPFAPLSDEEEE